MIRFESDCDPMPKKKTELANWINPGSIWSYNPARQNAPYVCMHGCMYVYLCVCMHVCTMYACSL